MPTRSASGTWQASRGQAGTSRVWFGCWHCLINRSLDEGGRRRVVEMTWEIIYADGRVTEFESNLMWRAAELLGISSRERTELRQRVAAWTAVSMCQPQPALADTRE